MKHFPAPLHSMVLVVALSLCGCTTVAEGVSSIATQFTTQTPSQVQTLAKAEAASTLVNQAADVAVRSGKLDRGTLVEIGALADAVHSALLPLRQAAAQGKSLDFAAFNAALQAWNAYAVAKGIST